MIVQSHSITLPLTAVRGGEGLARCGSAIAARPVGILLVLSNTAASSLALNFPS